MAFIDRLREARKNKGMTQSELGAIIGVSKATISSYESGNSDPDMQKIMKMLNVLEVDANYLFQDEPNEANDLLWAMPIIDAYCIADESTQRAACAVLGIKHAKPTKKIAIELPEQNPSECSECDALDILRRARNNSMPPSEEDGAVG